VRQALKGKVERLQFLDDRMLRLASRFAKSYQLLTGWDLLRTLELIRPVYGLLKGIPTGDPMASCYWRKKTPPPSQINPGRDRCGLLLCAPVAPMEGEHVARMVHLARELLLGYGFEPGISLTLITERSVCCVISIAYDRDEAGHDEQAMACYKNLLGVLTEHGYYSYRLGIQAMSEFRGDEGSADLLRMIKNVVDPNSILAPGRYQAT
jgi:4-cresol dehydrogenase (hydroxylating) flavoprotein subunit